MESIQQDLFAPGARLADPSTRIAERVTKAAITAAAVERLEQLIDRLDAETPRLRSFILPGVPLEGRSCTWRARCAGGRERRVVALGPDAVDPVLIVYLNRLSDLLFVMARAANHRAGVPETEW